MFNFYLFTISTFNEKEIARQFPTLPLSTILVAQQKFTEADINNDGVRIFSFDNKSLIDLL